MNRIPLIIDTDVALGVQHQGRPRDIDDGFAIAEALNSDLLDLRLITTVFGNGPLSEVVRVAREIVALKQSAVPVLEGAAESMAKNPASNAAVEGMAALLRTTRCAVAAIGPLTNMGILARDHPDAFRSITTLIIVAGRSRGRKFFIGDKGPVADFNFENDVDAARLMLEACGSTRVILAGFELTSQVCISARDLEVIAARNNPVATYFHRNSLAWCNWWTGQFPNDSGFHPWDSAAIALLKHPEYFVMEERSWTITPRPKGPQWLECDAALAGPRIHYCTGFTPGGKSRFVDDVVSSVY